MGIKFTGLLLSKAVFVLGQTTTEHQTKILPKYSEPVNKFQYIQFDKLGKYFPVNADLIKVNTRGRFQFKSCSSVVS